MTALTDDEITTRAIDQALRELPEPTREQAHDAVCATIAGWATSYWGIRNDGIDDAEVLADIRRLEHATRLLRAHDSALEELRAARFKFDDTPGIDWLLLVQAIDKIIDDSERTARATLEQANA